MPGRKVPTFDEFVAAQVEWSEYSDLVFSPGADYKVSVNNRLARRAGEMRAALRASPDWPLMLEALLTHESPRIRIIAAHDLFDDDPERALAIWSEIEHGPYGHQSSSAHWAAWGRVSRPASPKQATVVPNQVSPHPSAFDPERERAAEAVLTVHSAIMNGGFLTAFAVAGDYIPDAIRGYEEIGLTPVADLFRSGISLFPGGVLPLDAGERQRLVDEVIDAVALEGLDAPYDILVPSDEFLGERLDGYLDA